MTAALLSAAALLGYLLGCVDLTPLACEKFLKRDLRTFGPGKSGLEALYRETGWKGVAAVYAPECAKIILAVVAGGLLLLIRGHAETGRALTYFCLLLGTAFPATRRFRGSRAVLALILGALCVGLKSGLFVVVVFAAALWIWRYVSLGCVCGALAGILGAWVFAGEKITVTLALFSALVILARHAAHLIRICRHTEPKLSTKKDLSYKFDEDF